MKKNLNEVQLDHKRKTKLIKPIYQLCMRITFLNSLYDSFYFYAPNVYSTENTPNF